MASGERGVSADARHDYGETLLSLALQYDFGAAPQMIKVVLDAGANANAENDSDSCRPLDSEWLDDDLELDPHVEAKRALLVAAGAKSVHDAPSEVAEGDMTALDLSCREDCDDAMLAEIGREITELKSLSLEYCGKAGEAGLRALVGCRQLETLHLKSNDKVSDDTVRLLAGGLAHLKDLGCYGCPRLGDASLAALSEHCTSLTELDMTRAGCNEDDDEAYEEFHGFAAGRVTDAGVLSLASGCKKLLRLTLDLSYRITDSSVVTLAESFNGSLPAAQRRAPLLVLSLRGCKRLTDASVLAIATHAPLLWLVDFGELVLLTDAAVEALARGCARLCHLGLFACVQLGDRTLEAAEHAQSLERLNVDGCGLMSEEAVRALLVEKPNLHIDLGVNGAIHMGTSEVLSAEAIERRATGGARYVNYSEPAPRAPAAPAPWRIPAADCIPGASTEPMLPARVQIVGLASRAELNGTLATAESYVPSKGRYGVKLADGKIFALKPSNLHTV